MFFDYLNNIKKYLFSDEKGVKCNYCPNSTPYLCTANSNSFGLCKSSISECDNINSVGNIPIINNTNKEGLKYNYKPDKLNTRCNKIYKNYEYNSGSQFNLSDFSILTYNIWGLYRPNNTESDDFLRKTIKIRMNGVAKEILKIQPDIICFQEMTNIALEHLVENLGSLGNLYPFRYENNLDTELNGKIRNRDVEVYIFSKYPINKVTVYGIQGNQSYNTSFLIAEFGNLVVFNCYLQSGSRNSPGQTDYWYHYSRCRIDQIRQIKMIINQYLKSNPNLAIVVTGDFNFHLDGAYEDWPEAFEFKFLNDSYRILNPNLNGFTEDTDLNKMRWNTKFHEKKYRYDGILYKNLQPVYSTIIGTNPIILNQDLSNKMKKYWIPKNKDKLIKYEKNNLLSLYPSDHFGIITYFTGL